MCIVFVLLMYVRVHPCVTSTLIISPPLVPWTLDVEHARGARVSVCHMETCSHTVCSKLLNLQTCNVQYGLKILDRVQPSPRVRTRHARYWVAITLYRLQLHVHSFGTWFRLCHRFWFGTERMHIRRLHFDAFASWEANLPAPCTPVKFQ